MKEPYLIVFADEGALHFAKKLPTEDQPRELFHVPLDTVFSEDSDRAAQRVGQTILGILKLWHEEPFRRFEATDLPDVEN